MRRKMGALVVAAGLSIGITGVLAAPAGAAPPDKEQGYWNGTGPGGCRPQGFNWNPQGGNPETGQWAGWGNPPGQSVSFYCAPGHQS
jgi:hypothetical protein